MLHNVGTVGVFLRIAIGQAELFPLEDAKDLLYRSRRAETTGPILDPTAWLRRGDTERELADLLSLYMNFVAKAKDLAQRFPSLPVKSEEALDASP